MLKESSLKFLKFHLDFPWFLFTVAEKLIPLDHIGYFNQIGFWYWFEIL
jgi:hypothetical protein